MSKHNKKRNVGIIYEQIISFVCNKTISGQKEDAKKALNIIKKRFAKGTQLHKEYKLFSALINTKDISSSLSTSIINEAKKASNYHFDEKSLEKEKSLLIKELNYNFGKGVIFEQKVKNYKTYATVQTLLNEWRKKDRDIQITSLYESKLQEWMTSVEEKIHTPIIKVDPLVQKIMKEKFDKKYDNILSSSQKDILSFYFTNKEENEEKISRKFNTIKNSALKEMSEYKKSCNNEIILSNFENVNKNIREIDCNLVNETTLKKIMTSLKLIEEIQGEDN
jgi:hypothetical protein